MLSTSKFETTPTFYFSGSAHLLEHVHSFLERRLSLAPVQKIKINSVDAGRLRLRSQAFGNSTRNALCG
jgi:hypothetical protein